MYKKEKIIINIKIQMAKKIIKPYDKIQTVRELCLKYNCGRNTIINSLQDLEREKLLIKRSGVGYFVTPYREKQIKKDLLNVALQDINSANGILAELEYKEETVKLEEVINLIEKRLKEENI